MDNTPPGLTERGSGLANGPSFRRPGYRPPSASNQDGHVGYATNVTVIVHKDEHGYGMKVSGDNPVYVQSVKEGGAAERAGLHSGDKIIKVNGNTVTQSTHVEVVELIKSAPQVVLTVQQRIIGGHRPSPPLSSPTAHSRPLHHHHSAPSRSTERITGPQPVDHEKLVQLENQRLNTFRLMLEKEQRYVDALRSELAKNNNPKAQQELVGAERRVRTLQEQLRNLTANSDHEVSILSSTSIQTHQRTKSSPDPLNMQHVAVSDGSKRLSASDSLYDLSISAKKPKAFGSWDLDCSPRITPPGTPPPPYGGSSSSVEGGENTPTKCEEETPNQEENLFGTPPETSPLQGIFDSFVSGNGVVQQDIMSMEDDDMSDQEQGHVEDFGPFKSLSKLWEHNAHLAVFMNYVLSNSDPSSLLFYLVTDLYKEGNAKEMKKWAYEIHSSFLVPGAPLRLNNVDENVAREVDEVLQNESDKEEILRKVFWKARARAKEELNEQLADFQQKRTAGLGTLFGPPDAQLDESIHDKNKEMKIVEDILVRRLEPYIDDVEKETDIRRVTTAAALGTVLSKIFGVRSQHANSLLERCPTFVSKDKSLKSRLIGKTRKQLTIKGHHFVAHQYYTVTYCNHCGLIISGIGPQGYQCTNCILNIHRMCVKTVEESCLGPLNKKEKSISRIMEKIRNPERETRRKPSSLNLAQIERVKKQSEERDELGVLIDGDGDRPVSGVRTDRRPDPVRESEERFHDGINDEDDRLSTHHVTKKTGGTSINRSESYKERVQKRQLRERRKTSDPNLSKTSDVDLESQGLSYNTNSGSSSNSSLSRSSESPVNSLETVNTANSRLTANTTETVSVTLTPSSTQWDSDIEAEPDPPDWTRDVSEEQLKQLTKQQKKRLEVINELFHTERSHVRNLKVLDQVFYRPMLENQILATDQINLLFPNLEEMLEIHSRFNNAMKAKRQENPLVGDIGELLLSMFDGPAGEVFQKAAASFCARQQIALESLKERRRKDQKLNNFLNDAEGNPMCRRLQLKDIIPTGMLRLTKYPLLFENLAKCTTKSTEEYDSVLRALDRSKDILNYVNQAVKEAEDRQRLLDIQKKLDKSAFEKLEHPIANEFRNLDLTKHKLIYEGPLNWRIGNRQKLIDLHVVLLEEFIMLLQKQDDKYVLKLHNINLLSGREDTKSTHSPIIKFSTVLVRPVATDKRAFFLVNTSHSGAQIYELVAVSSSERKTWFRHISEAADAYKVRDGKNRRLDPSPSNLLSSPPEAEGPEQSSDKTKECDESTESRKDTSTSELNKSSGDEEAAFANEGATQPSGESTPQASPSSASDSGETIAKKTGESMGGSRPQLSPPVGAPGPSPTPSPGPQRRLPRLEPSIRLTEESPLIQPSEVVVSQRAVLTAEPVLTPIEKLRRKDEAIRLALAEKQQLVADILHVPKEEFETIAELAGEPAADKDAQELVLAAVSQANQLAAVLNETLRVTEEEAVTAASEVVPSSSPRILRKSSRLPGVPAHKLQGISNSLNAQLTQLLKIIKERDEERERLRKELQRSREQLHVMHESRRHHTPTPQSQSPAHSRPNSFISLGSSCDASEHMEPHDSEEDPGLQRLTVKSEQSEQIIPVPPTTKETEGTIEPVDDNVPEEFVDALSEGAESHPPKEEIVKAAAEGEAGEQVQAEEHQGTF